MIPARLDGGARRSGAGRGVAAYSTSDGRRLLYIPAAGMSALPDRPEHFVDWSR
ncbi:FAD/NAD(P)-binding protein [Kribbella sp. WER1]